MDTVAISSNTDFSMQQKKIQIEDEQERSTDLHLYSIVGEKAEVEYSNKSEGIYTEVISNTLAIHSSLHQNNNSNTEYDSLNKNKEGKSVSRIWFCVIILILLLLILISLATSVIITFVMKLSSDGDNQGNCNSLECSPNEELMNIIKHKIEEIENNTQKILAIEERELNLQYFVHLLNESMTFEYAFLNDKINQIYRNRLSGKTVSSPAPSCQAIHLLHPNSPSGYYWVASSNGTSVRVHCDMTKSCGNVTGGLTRVALLNNNTRPLICTGDFVTVNEDMRCIRNTEDPGCSHVFFPLMNISYSHICGNVEATWFGRPDGFTGSSRSSSTSINDNYVDGISLTYGSTSNRNHIWTFIADGYLTARQSCPRNISDYVGNSYSCLINENLCSSNNSCSHAFFEQFQKSLTEDIEMRLCRDGQRHGVIDSEGIYVGNVEIYVW